MIETFGVEVLEDAVETPPANANGAGRQVAEKGGDFQRELIPFAATLRRIA